jgi:glycosyltransferase involved in cell wall biosynthesis
MGSTTLATRIDTKTNFCIAPGRSEARAKAPRRVRRPRRVLFVTPYLPSPPGFGGQRRLEGLISGVAASHEVSVLSLVDAGEDQTEARAATGRYCRRVVTVPSRLRAAGRAYKRALQLGSLLSPWSYERIVHRGRALEIALDRLLAEAPFDVVHFEFPHMAAYRSKLGEAGRSRAAFLLDEHNIEYDVVRQTASAGPSWARRLYSAVDWRKVRAEELRAWTQLDGCTVTSARDQERLLSDAPQTRTAVVPNGVDLDLFRPSAAPPEAATLLFFGAIDYHPNTEGLLFFLDEVMPRLRARAPGVRLRIVGRRPPDVICRRRGPDVEVTGAVADVRPYLERAAVVIVPVRIGGGTRLKILEAMAMGKAVVSTSLGAEGLDALPERDLCLADDAESFAAQIQRLLDEPERARRLGAAARRLVEARYGWAASVARLTAFYDEVLDARGAP